MTIRALGTTRRVSTAYRLLALLLVAILAGCGDGWSTVTRHHIRCSGSGDSGRCEGRFGSLSGSYPETVESGFFSDDAVEVRAEVSVEQGRVIVSVESPEGDITDVEASPGSAVVLQGVAEVAFDAGDRAFDVTFEALDEQASGISYVIDYRPLSS